MVRNIWKAGAGLLALCAFTASASAAEQCSNKVWKKVMERGKMVVGVKADYKP